MFPIIIRDSDLAQFDIFYDQMDQSWHYMTDEVEEALANNYNPYKGVSSDNLTEYDNLNASSSSSNFAT